MATTYGITAFQYPGEPHVRRHGPCGYGDYTSYKPWLRDEFTFRCVFCLVRERWCHDGPNGFGVDHLIPKSIRPDLTCDYDNLLYLCNRCNSAKRLGAVIDPCKESLGKHISVSENGQVLALTPPGEHVIDAFNLNNARSTEYRRRKIECLSRCQENGDSWSIQQELAFPDDLPRLDVLRCSNTHPHAIESSFFALRSHGDLPPSY
jgi:hypothetical protein